MKLKQLGANMTELHLNNGTIVLFSYETPVAAFNLMGFTNGCQTRCAVIKTNKKWSRTTSKHITKWLDYDAEPKSTLCSKLSAFNVKEVDQSVLDSLIEGV